MIRQRAVNVVRRAKIISPPPRLSGWCPRLCATVAHKRGNHGDKPQWRGDYLPQSAVWLDAVTPPRPMFIGHIARARGTDVRPLAVDSHSKKSPTIPEPLV